MRPLLLIILVLVLMGCGREVKDLPAQLEATPIRGAEPAALIQQPQLAPQCERANKTWLRQRAAAEGSILRVFDVSRARRRTIELLNAQLAKIAAALERGCLEAP